MNFQLINTPNPELGITEQIFVNRGFQLKDVAHYLHTTDSDILNPLDLQHMKAGAAIVMEHIFAGHKMLIQVDSDCDGYTSAAALINYFHILFPTYVYNNIYYQLHDGKEHGIDITKIPEDVKLIIAPDSSSNEESIHKHLYDKDIDVVILDHHNADKYSQYACTINNQMCDYANKSLSGVGVVYKFCQYLDSLINTSHADTILDLVALGMIADMVDIRDFETKRLIDKGLANITNPFIKSMVAKNEFSLKGKLTPVSVAFYIAPAVNAVSRVGDANDKLLLFESMLTHKAFDIIDSTKRGCKGQKETRVEQACRNCTNLKNQQNRERDNELDRIDGFIKKHKLLDNKILMICLPKAERIDQNLTGLLANAIANKYQHPTLVMNEYIENNKIIWKGSGRNCGGTEFDNFQKFLLDSNYFELAQGHNNAFGVSIFQDNVEQFQAYANDSLAAINFEPLYKVDFIFDKNTLNDYDIAQIANLDSYWGQEIPEPWIAIKNLPLTSSNLDLLKGTTIKISFDDKQLSLIKFKSTEDEFVELFSEYGCTFVNIVGKCCINDWNNSPQIKIEDYEIVGKQEFYF